MGFKPTIFVKLLIIINYQRIQFSRRRIPNYALIICLMIAERNKRDGVCNRFSSARQSHCFDIINHVLRSISFRSEKSSSVVAVLNSHLQRSTCESSKYRTVLLRLQEDKHSKPKSAQLRSRREI